MTFAHWLMKLAVVAAPRERSEWAHAMSAEFAALEHGALSWAAGCLGTVFMWRLQSSALYLFALVALSTLWNTVLGGLIFNWSTDYAFAQPISQEEMSHLWMALSGAGEQLTLLTMSAALCAYRPQYAVITAIALWLATTGVLFTSMFGPEFGPLLLNAPFSSEDNNPALPNVIMAMVFFGSDQWPVVYGSFLGWAFARGNRRLAWTGSAFVLALVIAEYVINPGEAPPALETFTLSAAVIASAALLVAAFGATFVAVRDFRHAWRVAG